jgi:iron complex outermembrane recepter protein
MAQVEGPGLQPSSGSARPARVRRDLLIGGRLFQVLLIGTMYSGLTGLTAAQGIERSPQPDKSNTDIVQEVVVTGSRAVTNGSQAPTPVTVLGTDQLEAAAPSNIADAINMLPQLASSTTTRTGTYNVGNGAAGANFLNLRGFGANRTLVLLDGERVVPSTVAGIVDVNVIPSSLVNRVDIVTGGASAAYGSDAVTGVVNFVLDTKFEGVKGELQGGETQYNDDRQFRIDLTGGHGFGDGNGHAIGSVSYARNDGAFHPDSRPWFNGSKVMPNPAYSPGNGQPQQIIAPNVSFSVADQGGLVTGGPLKGTTFDANGQPGRYNYGQVGGIYMTGGADDDIARLIPLDARLEQESLFGRLSYSVSPAFRPYGEIIAAYANATSQTITPIKLGNLSVSINNAYLPQSVAGQMAAAGVTSLPFGTTNENLGPIIPINRRFLSRGVAGANGELAGDWKYDIYYQYGYTRTQNIVDNLLITNRFNNAIDARNVNGKVVCGNADPQCVPLDVFGIGVATPAAISYVNGQGDLTTNLTEQVASATVRGQPFNLWAGRPSLAAGVEHRRESADGNADALSLANAFFAGNFKPTIGAYSVTEGFAEVLLPLLQGSAGNTTTLGVDAAVRETDYSTSGAVTTWKFGSSWQPVADIRFRATRSRDIRAPNISDLFAGGVLMSNQSVTDPAHNRALTTGINLVTAGNPNLTPEISDALVLGTVITPTALPGLSSSIDYYYIKIHDAITALTAQQIVDECAGGNAALCSATIRSPVSDLITQINASEFNLAEEVGRGVDAEIDYRRALLDLGAALPGTVSARLLGSYVMNHYTKNGTVKLTSVGVNSGIVGLPRYRLLADLGYSVGRVTGTVTMRSVSSGVYDPTLAQGVNISDNHIAGATFFDFYLGCSLSVASLPGQLYLKVENLMNRDPPLVAGYGSQPYVQYGANPSLYDVLGRTFRLGWRFAL